MANLNSEAALLVIAYRSKLKELLERKRKDHPDDNQVTERFKMGVKAAEEELDSLINELRRF